MHLAPLGAQAGQRLRGLQQPRESLIVVGALHERRDLLAHPGMVGVQVSYLTGIQERLVDESPLNGHQSQRLEREILFATEAVRRLLFDHHQEILDPNSEFTVGIVAGLVADDHTGLQWCLVIVALGNALRPLVNMERSADAVPGAMAVIQTSFPERPPCKSVHNKTRSSFRKHRGGESDVALEHSCKALLFVRGRGAEVHSAGHIRCAIFVLGTRVQKKERSRAQHRRGGGLGPVVYHRTVGPVASYGIEGVVDVPLLPCTLPCDLHIHIDLCDTCATTHQGLELHQSPRQGRRIAAVRRAHACKFCCVLESLGRGHRRGLCHKASFCLRCCPAPSRLVERVIGPGWVQPDPRCRDGFPCLHNK
mmetsp:Transcript_129079/g.287676  ORF Transcript_129079/g.287676 Transcript_129079/m.287676 type:complete len:365 (-) Transcript_129079:507-1601(-)